VSFSYNDGLGQMVAKTLHRAQKRYATLIKEEAKHAVCFDFFQKKNNLKN